MSFKKVIIFLLTTSLFLMTLVGCKKSVDNSSSNVSENSNAVYGSVDIEDNNNSQTGSDDTVTDNTSSVVSEDSSISESTDTSSSTVSDPNINTNAYGKEIFGSGTKEDPFLDFPDADKHSVNTLNIPAGKSVFYNISRVGGRIFTINDANVYVVCDGTKYTAKDGKVTFKVVDALASDAVAFEICNTSSTDKSYTIVFTDLEGSMANPTVIKNFTEKITLNLLEGDEKGYFYKYVATKDGTLKFYLLSGTDKGILTATNNSNSAQGSTEDEADKKTDENGTYLELEVKSGDEIIINTGSKPNKRGKYPATTIEWTAKY